MSNTEQTLSIIKPDAVERNLTEDIKKIFIDSNDNEKSLKKKVQLAEYKAYPEAIIRVCR